MNDRDVKTPVRGNHSWARCLLLAAVLLLMTMGMALADGKVLVVPRVDDLLMAGDYVDADTHVLIMTQSTKGLEKTANEFLQKYQAPEAVFGVYPRYNGYTEKKVAAWDKSEGALKMLVARLRQLQPDALYYYCDPTATALNERGFRLLKAAAEKLPDPTYRGADKVVQYGCSVATATDLCSGEVVDIPTVDWLTPLRKTWGELAAPEIPGMPELNVEGFVVGDPFSYVDEKDGVWFYVSQGLKVCVTRHIKPVGKLVWYEAEIWRTEDSADHLHCYAPNGKGTGHKGSTLAKGTVLAVSSDYYQHRGKRTAGLIFRNGELKHTFVSRKVNSFPNLDTMMLTKDGLLQVNVAGELTAEAAEAAGACDVLSFGPMLVQDGGWRQIPNTYHAAREPRMAVGSLGENHYLIVFATGRLKESNGMSLDELQLLMLLRGAEDAINLDGGGTACMYFLGQKIGAVGAYSNHNVKTERSQFEMLTIGSYPEQ